jgi:hypothetical protein
MPYDISIAEQRRLGAALPNCTTNRVTGDRIKLFLDDWHADLETQLESMGYTPVDIEQARYRTIVTVGRAPAEEQQSVAEPD